MSSCPCGSGRPLALCCQPYISGAAKAPTAEALMRSRYSAYATHAIDYIAKTCADNGEDKIDLESTREWSEKSDWLGLKIVSTAKGGPTDSEGEVEFVASFSQNGKKDEHHEHAFFRKTKGEWLYVSGRMVTDTVVRETPKVGRNEPCPCGSGRKYKQCCGKA